MGVRLDTSYFDLWGNIKVLTDEERQYFKETVDLIKKALDCDIAIYPCNHEREHDGKSKEALGSFYTSDLGDLKRDCFITIDNYFIHECFEEKCHGGYNLNFQSLEEVICHEIAHAEQFRHCKRHSRITEELVDRVNRYKDACRGVALNGLISRAESVRVGSACDRGRPENVRFGEERD